jgi:hypothetical protein
MKKRTGIVELSSLSNSQATTANDQNLLDIHDVSRLDYTAFQVGLRIWRLLSGGDISVAASASEMEISSLRQAAYLVGKQQLGLGAQSSSRECPSR